MHQRAVHELAGTHNAMKICMIDWDCMSTARFPGTQDERMSHKKGRSISCLYIFLRDTKTLVWNKKKGKVKYQNQVKEIIHKPYCLYPFEVSKKKNNEKKKQKLPPQGKVSYLSVSRFLAKVFGLVTSFHTA